MMTSEPSPSPEEYASMLAEYVASRSPAAVEGLWTLSRELVERGCDPEEIVTRHWQAMEEAATGLQGRRLAFIMSDAHELLLEVLLAYCVHSRAHLDARIALAVHQAEVRTAEERERASTAERILREKTELLATVAHELRTPLSVVRGHLDLAVQLLSRGQTATALECLARASGAARSLTRLSADLLEASRGQPSRLESRPLDLTELVEQACASEQTEARQKSLALVPHTCPSRVQASGDPDAIASVLSNLVANAVRYTPAGGRVDVRHGAGGGWAWVEVADTGIGMPPEVQARIFEKFYRGPEAQRTEARGLGLGLSLAQQLVRAHGGRIEVESAPGRGSTFRVRLPLRKPRRPVE